MSVPSFLEELSAWAATRPEILGIALVGSHARGTARSDSDVDLVIVCSAPARLFDGEWVTLFGEVDSSALEGYGALTSLRVSYRSGLEVEFGVTDAAWLRAPLDAGTKRVLAAGARVLYDPQRLFREAQDAVAKKPSSRSAVRPLGDADEAAECARMMASSEPWLTLERGYEDSLAVVSDPAKEVHVLQDAAGLAGFVVVDMRGVLRGYIQSICVAPDRRGRGIGAKLLGWAEERIFRDSPNVFLCVSSFNAAAQRFYARLGYEAAGTLREFVVHGHDELLLRKSRGSWAAFRGTDSEA